MTMNINFWLVGEEETHITSLEGLTALPFSKGDHITFDVEDIYPVNYRGLSSAAAKHIRAENENITKLVHLKKVEIKEVFSTIRFNKLNDAVLKVDYYCVLID